MSRKSKKQATKVPEETALIDALRELLEDDAISITQREADVIRDIAPTKIGQSHEKFDMITHLRKFLKEEGFVITEYDKNKRIYRRKKDLFDETKDPKSEANVLQVKLAARVSREYRDRFKAAAAHFPTQRDALECAIELLEQRVADKKVGPEMS